MVKSLITAKKGDSKMSCLTSPDGGQKTDGGNMEDHLRDPHKRGDGKPSLVFLLTLRYLLSALETLQQSASRPPITAALRVIR